MNMIAWLLHISPLKRRRFFKSWHFWVGGIYQAVFVLVSWVCVRVCVCVCACVIAVHGASASTHQTKTVQIETKLFFFFSFFPSAFFISFFFFFFFFACLFTRGDEPDVYMHDLTPCWFHCLRTPTFGELYGGCWQREARGRFRSTVAGK